MQQEASRIRKHHFFVSAFKHLRPKAILKGRQLFGKRWLRKAQLFPGSRQRRRLRHGKEDSELVEGHMRGLVGWVEAKRLLSVGVLPKPINVRPETMIGFDISTHPTEPT